MKTDAAAQTATLIALLAGASLGCSFGEPEVAFAGSSTTHNVSVADQGDAKVLGEALRLVLASSGNEARYRVREQLAGHDLPNDAIGKSASLTGALSIDSAGNVIRSASKFSLDAGSFVSDQSRRDGFVRRRLLEADDYPTITLVPAQIRGVKLPLPKSGSAPIEMTADLTVHGVTRPTTWKGSVEFADGSAKGSASTAFTFEDLQLDQPRVPVLLSVADTIRLEIDFNLVKR